MIKNFIDKKKYEYSEDVSIKNINSYRLSLKCKYLIFPKNTSELVDLIKFLKKNSIKYMILGGGSNVIFSCEYYDGVIIKLDHFKDISVRDCIVDVGAGYSLIKLASEMSLSGLSGLEFACGIPGCIGASVAMNAGAYKHSLSEVVESVEVLNDKQEVVTMTCDQIDFSYRDSFFKRNPDYVILSCKLKLSYGDKKEILRLISNRRVRRIETQPLDYPSAGSVFRNPEGMFAGELIEKCGLKGYKIGGAKVSEKHANFIINDGGATGRDIVDLINKVKKVVKETYNVDLILEQIIID